MMKEDAKFVNFWAGWTRPPSMIELAVILMDDLKVIFVLAKVNGFTAVMKI